MTVISAVSPVILVKFFFENPVAGEKLIKVHAHACMATIYLYLNLWVLVQSDLRGDFSCSNSAGLALEVASLVVRYRNRVIPTSLAGFLARVARRNARVFASAERVKSSPCRGIPHQHKDIQILLQNNAPVSLSASLLTVVVQSLNFVELRKTSDFPCNTSWDVQTAIEWARFFS